MADIAAFKIVTADFAAPAPAKPAAMDLQLFMEAAAQHDDPVKLFHILARQLRNVGFDKVAYVNFDLLEQPETPLISRLLCNTFTYAPGWVSHYVKEQFSEYDVLFQLARTNPRPLNWEQVRQKLTLTKKQQLVFDEGYDAGHKFGLTIPLFGPAGLAATLSVATSGTVSDAQGDRVPIIGLASQFHFAFEVATSFSCLQDPPPVLSPREYECLSWVAQGKSTWDISQIIGIAEATVQFHIRNVMRKLGVNSRVAAVFKAARLGVIS